MVHALHFTDYLFTRLDLVVSIPIVRIGVDEADTDAWNQVANAVGCGSCLFSLIYRGKEIHSQCHILAPTSAQLACMQAVDAHTLEQATIDAGVTFSPIVDGTPIVCL